MSDDIAEASSTALKAARTHLANANYDAAVRLCQKSIRLKGSAAAEALLKEIEQAKANPGLRNRGSASNAEAGSSKPSSAPKVTTPKEERAYTKEQVAVVKRIRGCKRTAYYEILAIEKTCEENEIKKAYRKHSLSVHPDKNGAPGADEAFKMVSTAFQTLSDPDKRAHFDRYGSDPGDRSASFSNSSSSFGNFSGPRSRGDEMSPEDLFNMFFGGGNLGGMGGMRPGMRTYTFGPGMGMHQAQRRANNGPQENSPIWLQLLPLILLFGLSILSQVPSWFTTPPPPDPTYVYSQTARHTLQRQTQNLRMDYWVNGPEFKQSSVFNQLREANPSLAKDLDALEETQPNFQPISSNNRVKIPRAFTDFESRVENTRLSQLKLRCEGELDQQNRKIQQFIGAFGFIGRDEERLKQAREQRLPHCDELERFGYVVHRNR